MPQLGFSVMLGLLGGASDWLGSYDQMPPSVQAAQNQKIASLRLDQEHNTIHLEFANGYKLRLWDDGQSCCESRYITTDDHLADFVGALFIGAEIADGPVGETEYGDYHEIQFLRLLTSSGYVVFATHNEHNGYYGGFAVKAAVEGDATQP